MIYSIMIMVCGIIAYSVSRCTYVNSEGRKYLFREKITALIPILVAGLRAYSVGTDTGSTYLEIYKIAQNNVFSIRDLGFGILNYLMYKIFDNFTAVLVITSLIMYSVIFYRIYKNSKIPYYSVLLFFCTDYFFISMNMVRQSMVVALFILILPLCHSELKRDKIIYFLISLIGVSIHSSGILLFVLYFIYRYIKLTPQKCIVFTFINYLIYRLISNVVIKFFFSVDYLKKYFSWYFNSGYNNGQLSIFGILIPFSILVFTFFIYKTNSKVKEDDCFNDLTLSLMLAGNIAIYSTNIPLIERIAFYFNSQLIILLPCIFGYMSNKRTRVICKFIVFIAYLAYMYITIFVQGQEEVLPYCSVL